MVASYYGRIKSVELLLKTGRCDPFIKDACGEMALHHAVKQGHYSVLKALLKQKEEPYLEESGLALTPFDLSMLTLLINFPEHRNNENDTNDVSISTERRFIYNHLQKVQTNTRVLAKTDDVVRVTDIMIDCALAATEAEKAQSKRRYPSDDEAKSLDDFHCGDVTTDSNEELPDFPAVTSGSDDAMDEEDDDEAPESLKGMHFTISGHFSMKQDELAAILKEHGAAYSSSMTKAVTHLLVADPDEQSAKTIKAKSEGIKIVGENFLKNILKKGTEKEKKKKVHKKK